MEDDPRTRGNTPTENTGADYLLWRREPPPRWRCDVSEIFGYQELSHTGLRQREPANLLIPLVISFGDPFSIAIGRSPGKSDRISSFVAGLIAEPVEINSSGRAACVQVNFTPLGAFRFFNIAMHSFSGRLVCFDDLLGAEADRLRTRLGEEPSWPRRLDMVERYIYCRLERSAASSAPVKQAMLALTASHGVARIGDIAERLGWSRKHLAERF